MPEANRIVVLHGDQTGEELLQKALQVLDPKLLDVELEFEHFDLSVQKRRETQNGVGLEGDGKVIVRTGRRIPGVRPVAAVYAPISVIRMAVDDAYGAHEWREGEGLEEWAYRTEKGSRRTSRT